MKTVFLNSGELLTVTLPVEERHIREGHRGKCWECPVALALNEIFPEFIAEVDMQCQALYEKLDGGEPGKPVLLDVMNEGVRNLADRFDSGYYVPPQRIQLRLQALCDVTVKYVPAEDTLRLTPREVSQLETALDSEPEVVPQLKDFLEGR